MPKTTGKQPVMPFDLLNDALQVLQMVDDNARVRAGENIRAWNGAFVQSRVREVLEQAAALKDMPSAINLFRVIEVEGGFQAEQSYQASVTGAMFWTPLLASGMWAEPDSYSFGEVRRTYPLPSRSVADDAIARAKMLIEGVPMVAASHQVPVKRTDGNRRLDAVGGTGCKASLETIVPGNGDRRS